MAVTLRDFISGDEVLTIESHATLGAAARQMWNRSVGAAVVVEWNATRRVRRSQS